MKANSTFAKYVAGAIAKLGVLIALLAAAPCSRADVPVPGASLATELNWWTFSGTDWPSGMGTLPVAFTNISCVPGAGATALSLESTNQAFLIYNLVEPSGATNLAMACGSVEVWFAPAWSSANAGGAGPGAVAPMIQTGRFTTNATYGLWSLCIAHRGRTLRSLRRTGSAGKPTIWPHPSAGPMVFGIASISRTPPRIPRSTWTGSS